MIAIAEALKRGTQAIQSKQVSQTPLLDASLLLCAATGMRREQLYSRGEQNLGDREHTFYEHLVARRCEAEPIAYLTGSREFFGHTFCVTPDVLIPRPDTEILVEQALTELQNLENPRVLDLCTGSGCIGISVASAHDGALVTLADISKEALALALANSRKILGRELECVEGDLFSALQNRHFHMIMTNPPYLNEPWYELAERQVKREPRLALVGGGEDGLQIIRRIIEESPAHLEQGGMLLIECDHRQNDLVGRLLTERGFSRIGQRDDLAQLRRIVWGTWHV